jgi:hypothetical protein
LRDGDITIISTIGMKHGDDMEYVEIDKHKMHVFSAGDENKPT